MSVWECEWCHETWNNQASADTCCSETRWGDDD